MAKKKTPQKTAKKQVAKATKGTGKKPAKRPLAKPAKRSLIRSIQRPLTKPAKRSPLKLPPRPLAKPTKSPAKDTTIKAATTGRQAAEPAKSPVKSPAKSPVQDAKIEAAATSRPAAEPTPSPAQATTIEAPATMSRPVTEEVVRPEHIWVVWQDGRGIWVGTQPDFKLAKRPETIVCDVIDRGTHPAAAALHRAIQLGETLRQTYANYMKSWLQYDDAAQKQRIQEWYERL